MLKHLNLALICLLAFGSAKATEFELSVDKYFSPFMGANWMISGLRGYQMFDDAVLTSTAGDTSYLATSSRIAKLGLEFTVTSWVKVGQHEYFGHGARGREFRLGGLSYKIRPFTGHTTYTQSDYNHLHPQQRAAFAAAGMEATSILADKLETSMLQDGMMDRREAMMYMVNSLDETVYIMRYGGSEMINANNDIGDYINQVNAWQGSKVLNIKNLRFKNLWNICDPMLYFSLYSMFRYIWLGEAAVEIPRLDFKGWAYLPTTRTLLAPYGPELQLNNHFYNEDRKYIGVNFRVGRTGGINSYGVDLNIRPFKRWCGFEFGNKLSLWRQPHLLKNDLAGNSHAFYGAALFINATYYLNKTVALSGEVGHKTSGYLPGTQLRQGYIARAGVLVNLAI